jgi:aryl-alcohol dehydrogenase-like predicted oxidoreductase
MVKAHGISDHRGWARFESVQSYYSIAGRDLEREIVPMLADQQMGLMVWSPLAGGLLSGKFTRDNQQGEEGARRASFDFPPVNRDRAWTVVDAMREVGDEHGVSVARVALAYVLAKPFVTTVIIGAKRLDQLDDNIAAASLELTPAQMEKLDAASALPPEYPGWMFERQGSHRVPRPFKPKP